MTKTNETNSEIASLTQLRLTDLMTDANRVACVHMDNSLEHALLILIKSGYSAVPVIDRASHVVGVISKTRILDSILGPLRIEFDDLDGKKVSDAMNSEVPRISEAEGFLRALELSINSAFLCVDNSAGEFIGILTRRTVLASLYKVVKPELRTQAVSPVVHE